jgi:hypothetical protein
MYPKFPFHLLAICFLFFEIVSDYGMIKFIDKLKNSSLYN